MGMTMTQKILAAHAGLDTVEAGQLIEAKLDIVMANDITGPMALPIIRQMSDKVFDKDKVVFVPDHFKQEWERPMWQPEWRQEKSGLKCRRRSSLF